MSVDSKKSISWTAVLILLGIAAILGGTKWLLVVVPAGLYIWYGAALKLRGGRN